MCAVSPHTILKMERQGAVPEWVAYAKQTQHSMDPDDVRFHRELIDQYSPNDMYRHVKIIL